jgi:hypothetical protein
MIPGALPERRVMPRTLTIRTALRAARNLANVGPLISSMTP